MGAEGLKKASEYAVLNANYLKEKLKKTYRLPYDQVCKHEFVLSAKEMKDRFGVTAVDIAKRLLDYGVHPPTIYCPLIVAEALMIEPTETESRETLDAFLEVMGSIGEERPRRGPGTFAATLPNRSPAPAAPGEERQPSESLAA